MGADQPPFYFYNLKGGIIKMSTTTLVTYRSRLNTLPLELKMKLGEVSFQKGMLASSRRNRMIELLKDYKLPFTEIGTGTNRFVFKYDSYVIKVALDKEGIADNRQDWVIADMLTPDIAYTHEISKGGHLLIADYCPAFTSYAEMSMYMKEIKTILQRWSTRFLLGDVGFSKVNYANWGLSPGGKPVCIDYSYIFPASMDLFKCICGNKTIEPYDTSYTSYKCSACGKRYEDRDLRSRISQKTRLEMFNNTKGIIMSEPYQQIEVDSSLLPEEHNPDAPTVSEIANNLVNRVNFDKPFF